MELIDKDALVAEIERRIKEISKEFQESNTIQFSLLGKVNALENLLPFIDTLEVKEVDLKKEIQDKIYNHFYDLEGNAIAGTSIYATVGDMEHIARHFFELGLKAHQENNVIGTIEREVKTDAGGYPCIDCYIEFYDYDKDIPLAKEGDKVKIVVIKGK
jgi:hypothetical protein